MKINTYSQSLYELSKEQNIVHDIESDTKNIINAASRLHGMTYSQLINKLKSNNIEINRKVLADLAVNNPDGFKAIIQKVK